ncbi:MAG: hypothetical protein AB1500_03165 [Bacillota bacterium]
MNQDEQQLDLLSIFHYIVGGINALFSCFPFIHLALGIAMLCGGFGEDEPPAFLGWIFTVIPAVLILSGWALSALMILAGRNLKRRAAYTFCLVVAASECILIPFGTVLGVLTLIVLTRESVKKIFEEKKAPAVL